MRHATKVRYRPLGRAVGYFCICVTVLVFCWVSLIQCALASFDCDRVKLIGSAVMAIFATVCLVLWLDSQWLCERPERVFRTTVPAGRAVLIGACTEVMGKEFYLTVTTFCAQKRRPWTVWKVHVILVDLDHNEMCGYNCRTQCGDWIGHFLDFEVPHRCERAGIVAYIQPHVDATFRVRVRVGVKPSEAFGSRPGAPTAIPESPSVISKAEVVAMMPLQEVPM